MHSYLRACVAGVAIQLFSIASFAAEPLKLPIGLRVEAGQRERVDALVEFPVSEAGVLEQPLRLVETTGDKDMPVPIQVDPAGARLWWVAVGTTPAGAKRTYRLEAGSAAASPRITLVDSEGTVEARLDDKPLVRYNKAHVEPPAGTNPKYGRSAHLHPLWTLGGAVVTDEFPPDHLHQSGVFLAHTKTEFEGHEVDFWNLAGGKGRVRFKELKGLTSGPIFGSLRSIHEHVDLTAAGQTAGGSPAVGGKVAVVETWDMRVWNVGLKSGHWLLDITSRASCASDRSLRMPEYHYGGMAIRAARPWTPQNVRFFTSDGHSRIDGNHQRVRWCDVSGDIDERLAGVTMMTHPSNFRFPEPLRIHPTMPYMVYTPSFLGEWEIRPSMAHESRYRLVIHDGEMSRETLERLWQDFAEPLVAVGG